MGNCVPPVEWQRLKREVRSGPARALNTYASDGRILCTEVFRGPGDRALQVVFDQKKALLYAEGRCIASRTGLRYHELSGFEHLVDISNDETLGSLVDRVIDPKWITVQDYMDDVVRAGTDAWTVFRLQK